MRLILKLIFTFIFILSHSHTHSYIFIWTQHWIQTKTIAHTLTLIRIDVHYHIHIHLCTITLIRLESHPHTVIYIPNHTEIQTCIPNILVFIVTLSLGFTIRFILILMSYSYLHPLFAPRTIESQGTCFCMYFWLVAAGLIRVCGRRHREIVGIR